MEEYEPAENGVEWFGRTPTANLAVDKRHVTLARLFDALACNGKRLRGPVESQDRSRWPDQLPRQPRNVAESCAEIEHAKAGSGEPGRLQKKAGRRRNKGRLSIQSRQLLLVAAEDVCVFASHHRIFIRRSEARQCAMWRTIREDV
jgi:hypothetical protein